MLRGLPVTLATIQPVELARVFRSGSIWCAASVLMCAGVEAQPAATVINKSATRMGLKEFIIDRPNGVA
jgi:hypothetical protein